MTIAASLRIEFRPLLVQGQLATDDNGILLLIDSEQPDAEKIVTIWHETLHLLGLTDEEQVESMANKLAAACPEILQAFRQ